MSRITAALPHALTGATLGVLAALILLGGGRDVPAATAATASSSWQMLRADSPAPRLRFGIYPGGGVGKVVDDGGAAVADDKRRREAALRRLGAGGQDLVLHVYTEFSGGPPTAAALEAATYEARDFAADGFLVELVVRYRPASPGTGSPAAYARYVRAVTAALAPVRRVVSIQVGNEANVLDAPLAADGDFPGVRLALVKGVIAAKAAARRAGRRSLTVGINWAAAGNLESDTAFWRALRDIGGARFRRALDWVGVDVYPGTWSDGEATSPDRVQAAVLRSLGYLRGRALPAAGLGHDIALRVCENGFPTSTQRSETQQASLMEAAIRAVERVRVRYGVTDYRWFDLRDTNTSGQGFENGYGVLRDDYSEKPGFAVLARLIGELGR